MNSRATPKTAMTLQVRNEGGTSTLDIYDVIGDWGLTDRDVNDTLKGLPKGTKRIDVNINSAGGDVFAGLAIYNILANHKAKVHVHINGLAASIASVIAMAGDEISIAENAFVMIHNPWVMAIGESNDLRKTADEMDKVKASLVKTYVARTGKDEADIIDMMDAETWLDADEAIEHGFADRMVAAKKIAAKLVAAWPEEYAQRFAAGSVAASPNSGDTAMEIEDRKDGKPVDEEKPQDADAPKAEDDEEEEDEEATEDEPQDADESEDEEEDDEEDEMEAKTQAAYDNGYGEANADQLARIKLLDAYFAKLDPAFGMKAMREGWELARAKAEYNDVLVKQVAEERDLRTKAEARARELGDEVVALDDGAAIRNDAPTQDETTAKHLKTARAMNRTGAIAYLKNLNIDPGLLDD